MSIVLNHPERHEAPDYYFNYINLVPQDVDIRTTLSSQLQEMLALFEGISDQQARHRYAPDKWSIRQMLAHLNDTERVFAFRAFWFARGFEAPLPSFDQNVAAERSNVERPCRRVRRDPRGDPEFLAPSIAGRMGAARGRERLRVFGTSRCLHHRRSRQSPREHPQRALSLHALTLGVCRDQGRRLPWLKCSTDHSVRPDRSCRWLTHSRTATTWSEIASNAGPFLFRSQMRGHRHERPSPRVASLAVQPAICCLNHRRSHAGDERHGHGILCRHRRAVASPPCSRLRARSRHIGASRR